MSSEPIWFVLFLKKFEEILSVLAALFNKSKWGLEILSSKIDKKNPKNYSIQLVRYILRYVLYTEEKIFR